MRDQQNTTEGAVNMTQRCRFEDCSKDNPAEARFCMFCGKSLAGPKDREWTGEVLEISLEADFGPLRENFNLPEDVVSDELIKQVVKSFPSKQTQRFIRYYGLHGGPRMSMRMIAGEDGKSPASVNQAINNVGRVLKSRINRSLLNRQIARE
ncbi:MAG: hypothetical protein WD187_00585 [Candidatus Woykebacteria bacterium]